MVTPVMSADPFESSLFSVRQELFDLLKQEENGYPWNPADPLNETYFEVTDSPDVLNHSLDALEAPVLERSLETNLEINASRFFAIAHQSWQAAALRTIKANLWEKFARYIPSHSLDQIFAQAQALAHQNLSNLDELLVTCVQPLWSNWNNDTLLVIARPLGSLRSGEEDEGRISRWEQLRRPVSWDELTEIEQIRLTMIAAQEALMQLGQEQD